MGLLPIASNGILDPNWCGDLEINVEGLVETDDNLDKEFKALVANHYIL